MLKVKYVSLVKYRNELQGRLESEVPEKHITHPKEYKQYLINELQMVNALLDKAKEEGIK